jgi:competence protein ComFB
MSVRNLMEDIVKGCLKDMLQRQPIPDCDEALQSDIMAIALNRLPPKYVSTLKGEVFAKTQMRLQVEPDVYRELSLAVEKVMHSARKSDFS